MKYPQIRQAKAVDNTTLMIEFTNQEVKKYDICHLLDVPMFSALRQPAFFKNFKVEQGGMELCGMRRLILASMSFGRMIRHGQTMRI
jgi:Protein of unknown function (DUF2442)